MGKRLLVCGGRYWKSYEPIYREVKARMPLECIIHGGALGADTLADMVGKVLGIPVLPFPADWSKHGRSAGPIRNRRMLKEGRPTEVIGFHANIEQSKGTHDMLTIAKQAGLPTTLYVS